MRRGLCIFASSAAGLQSGLRIPIRRSAGRGGHDSIMNGALLLAVAAMANSPAEPSRRVRKLMSD
jgi:hypothetical protein